MERERFVSRFSVRARARTSEPAREEEEGRERMRVREREIIYRETLWSAQPGAEAETIFLWSERKAHWNRMANKRVTCASANG